MNIKQKAAWLYVQCRKKPDDIVVCSIQTADGMVVFNEKANKVVFSIGKKTDDIIVLNEKKKKKVDDIIVFNEQKSRRHYCVQ